MTGPYVCIARLDDPDVVAKAIGPFPNTTAAQSHLDDVVVKGLVDLTQFTITVENNPTFSDDTNIRSAP